ncbi:hypothetical protein TNCV_245711 [Trichonephila clavipes]|nr:hypothetical protein TNCV_245711 [Trichonephila clavipes]
MLIYRAIKSNDLELHVYWLGHMFGRNKWVISLILEDEMKSEDDDSSSLAVRAMFFRGLIARFFFFPYRRVFLLIPATRRLQQRYVECRRKILPALILSYFESESDLILKKELYSIISTSPLTLRAEQKNCQVIYSQFGLAIHQNDHQARRRFVEWAQNEIAVVPDFHKRILFSDEAHFLMNGYVNKQNCRIWSEANRQVYVETPLHPEKLTVWCALWAGGILLQKR